MALVVELVSPERVAYTGEAKMVICRTTTGDIAFLPGHVPFIGVLATHPVRVLLEEGGEQIIAVHQGFVEVSPPEDGATRVTILSDVCELADTIDVATCPGGAGPGAVPDRERPRRRRGRRSDPARRGAALGRRGLNGPDRPRRPA